MEIGNEKRPIHCNINAMIELKKDHGIDVLGEGLRQGNLGFEQIRALVFIALKHGAKKEGKEFTVTVEDVGEWMTLGTMKKYLDEVLAVFMDGVELKEGTGTGEQVGANSAG